MRRKIFGLLPVPRLSEIPESFLRYLDVNFKRIEDALTELFNTIPPGTVAATYSVTAPTGWLFLRGQSVSAVDYPALAEAMGVTGTFSLPDTRGKVIVGLHPSDTDWDTLGELRGAKTVALSMAEMPTHDHLYGAIGTQYTLENSGDPHVHNSNGNQFVRTSAAPVTTLGGGGQGVDYITDTSNESDPHLHEMPGHDHGNVAQGSGTAHNNIQPSIVMNYMIKT